MDLFYDEPRTSSIVDLLHDHLPHDFLHPIDETHMWHHDDTPFDLNWGLDSLPQSFDFLQDKGDSVPLISTHLFDDDNKDDNSLLMADDDERHSRHEDQVSEAPCQEQNTDPLLFDHGSKIWVDAIMPTDP